MLFHTTTVLSPKQELTPEGFLLCRDVAIARTGTQLYAAQELPRLRAVDGLVRAERLPEDVFSDRTIASFQGKSVTLDHPDSDVRPDTWKALTVGLVQNVRRGAGLDHDLLLADLLVMDAEAIHHVRDNGLREVSCGYDAEYEELEPGRTRQYNIVGNHVALVEKGRCGTRCAIGDTAMKTTTKWMDRLRAAFKSHDEAALEEALKESASDSDEETEEQKKKKKDEEDSKTSDAMTKALDALTGRLAALEARDQARDEAKPDEETEEEKKQREAKEKRDKEADQADKTGDSAALVTASQDIFARAEILSPGLSLPTFDSAAPKKFRDSLCDLKRRALTAAYHNPKTRDAVMPLVGGVNLSTLTCDSLHATFVGASEIVRRENNAFTNVTFDSGTRAAAGVATQIADMNRRNAAFWTK